ncbi:MAG: hypothetical protein AUJ92_13735 [Armatimonadetes bacterium CG2_30_59_28]|nr:MAG: hypothetical protein AUJ92_13735 [Armatimonadetes bacterium CG2_30_59_28]PIU63923.1 MAG: hypothetical protein COS85_14555 [Armatimonadetes bacterium CG07_land_8_20_14_0_80_59_28]PIX37961.1 MAG: hypothetical protein COZ56_21840 [Armatimonadetes bacterium CG_4_8_14_3_um_filter_58_9]PIY41136.1 MAG: hypothetical protein COZ05_16195 [Armatimonadetes bacterium CG_4_10_14_3_um_filter_59_10]
MYRPLWLVMLAMILQATEGAVLTQNGQPRCGIVLSDRPTRSAQLAAAELREHVRLISGATLPIARETAGLSGNLLPIYVGESGATRSAGLLSHEFHPQESLIRVTDKAVCLLGRDDPDFGEITYEQNGAWPNFNAMSPFYRVGTLYAVYSFLERFCGVRWYMVTDLGTVIPKSATIRVKPTEQTDTPWTCYRRIGSHAWGIPGQYGRLDGSVRRYDKHPSQRDLNLYQLRTRMGGEPFSVNHSVYDYYKRFGKERPDWFVGNNPGPSTQLKYHLPDVIDQVVADAEGFFSLPFIARRFGGKDTHAAKVAAGDFFPVVPLDNRDYGDEADPPLQPERQGKHFGSGVASNYIFTWVNRVAAKVAVKFPDAWISAIAYAGMFEPPDLPMQPNVAVGVAMADGWEGYGMDTLREWRKRVSRLYTWEYHYAWGGRFPLIRPHQVASYLNQLRSSNVEGMFMEMGDHNAALCHLDYYVTARMLIDPRATVDSILAEYFRLFYGPAEKPMARFWKLMEETSASIDELQKQGRGVSNAWVEGVGDSRMDDLRRCVEEAERLAAEEPYTSRVKMLRSGILDMLSHDLKFHQQVAASPLPIIVAKKVTASPKVDGKLDDAAWNDAQVTREFVTPLDRPQRVKTVGMAAYDDQKLYIGMRCSEPGRMGEIRLFQKRSTSSICADDSVEIFLDHDANTKDFIQIMANTGSYLWYQWKGKYLQADLPDLGIEVKAWSGADEWSMEVAVPFDRLQTDAPKPGAEWRINLMRNRFMDRSPGSGALDEIWYHMWSPSFTLSYHVPDRFGVLRFE